MSSLTDIIFNGTFHYLTSGYGWRTLNGIKQFHNGADYGTNMKNLPMYAVSEGVVQSAGYESGGAGYYIWIKYPNLNKRFAYFHMQSATPLKTGSEVSRWTFVGYTGTTGNSTGVHLHLGIRDLTTGEYFDPEAYAQLFGTPGESIIPLSSTRYIVNLDLNSFLNVRTGDSTSFRTKTFNELTSNAQSQILNLANKPINGFVNGMVFDSLEIKKNWARTYSGWVCLDYCEAI